MVVERMAEGKMELAEKEIKVKLKDRLTNIEGKAKSLNKDGLSKYELLIKTVSQKYY